MSDISPKKVGQYVQNYIYEQMYDEDDRFQK